MAVRNRFRRAKKQAFFVVIYHKGRKTMYKLYKTKKAVTNSKAALKKKGWRAAKTLRNPRKGAVKRYLN